MVGRGRSPRLLVAAAAGVFGLGVLVGLGATEVPGWFGGTDSRPCDAEDPSNGCIVVHQRLVGQLYTEGSLSYVRVQGSDMDVTRQLEGVGSTPRILSLALEPGTYELESFQRPCGGNCGTLDPATDRCLGSFAVKPGAQVTATLTVTPGQGCTIDFEG